MKKLLLVFALMIFSISFSQNKEQQHISLITAPGAYEDGANYGWRYTYEHTWGYVGGELFLFPKLNHTGNRELGYGHLVGRFGVKTRFKLFNPLYKDMMIYVGSRTGFIARKGYNHHYQMLGGEIGFQWTIPKTPISLNGSLTHDLKNDSKIWGKDKHTVNSVFVGVGYTF